MVAGIWRFGRAASFVESLFLLDGASARQGRGRFEGQEGWGVQ